MDRVAVFVDSGYIFAQGSLLLAGKKLPRAEITLIHEAAIKAFSDFATKISNTPLLRVYWYDGTSTGPTAQHLTLAHLHDVKVRLGFVNSVGEQKGVDSLIVTDMIVLARNRAISDAVLVSGDEDLRVGVQQARLEQTEIEALVEAVERLGQVPRDVDAQLLGGARAVIGRDLSPAGKKDLRRHFIEQCRTRMR